MGQGVGVHICRLASRVEHFSPELLSPVQYFSYPVGEANNLWEEIEFLCGGSLSGGGVVAVVAGSVLMSDATNLLVVHLVQFQFSF